MPFLSSCQGFSPWWRYAVGILISNSDTAQPISGSHSSWPADPLVCSQICLITVNLPRDHSAVSCLGLPWSNLILVVSYGFTSWFDLRATVSPWTRLIIWTLFWTWLPPLSLSCIPCLGSVGSRLLLAFYHVQVLSPLPLRSSQPSLYPERSVQSTVTHIASPKYAVQITGKFKIFILHFQDPQKGCNFNLFSASLQSLYCTEFIV